ncbi:type VI secretion system baseplate subunit TssE [uncultured Paludibaculum sp.]|uniref:type VI secretion system baseplate subunit TssE n=1 Tax=uncultured Paludibaculum sp. TaxID=1765020 RepID=UPI002AAC40C8|nr:type VI secretion system baseplate subunit TssE [uncultured Paludibaculum sp.]
MASQLPEQTLQQPLLDRLIDHEPWSKVEMLPSRAQAIRALKESIKRDLEWVFNTRKIVEESPKALAELKNSLYNFGLMDMTSVRLHSPEDEKTLLRAIESAVEFFEPRLKQVRVSSQEPLRKQERNLHFQIDAMLMLDPSPEAISFDTYLDLTRGEYQVKA